MTDIGSGIIAVGAALAVGLGALGTGWAQATIGAAAMGVIAERPEESSKLLVYLALPETIVIFGFVVGVLMVLSISGA
ncbi:MAG: hypothetical protein QXW70_02920 [Candidatus Anstonellales archaeon]